MFGYVVMNKPEIKFKDFDLYRSFYCGLCRELREKYGSYAELFDALFHSGSGTRTLMDGYMDAMQTAVYALSAVGGARLMKKKDGMAALASAVRRAAGSCASHISA